jgi:hypothetical protein
MKADNEMSLKKFFSLPKVKKIDLKKRIRILDTVFSEYIRRRDADKNGICRCITCGRPAPWREMDAGHFVSRNHKAVRWDERNVHAQCRAENRFQSGKQYEHGKEIDRKYGIGTADLLIKLGSSNHVKISLSWVEYQIKLYKEKIKNI